MRHGCDYSWGRPTPVGLLDAGVSFVVRYVADTPGTSGKRIHRPEADALTHAGLDIVSVYQTTKSFMQRGHLGGVEDAKQAHAQAVAAGMPPTRPIYFAADWDVTITQQAAVNAYLDGARTILGANRVGLYGGLRTITRALTFWLTQHPGDYLWTWQTLAWSGGVWADVNMRQIQIDVTIAGADCDWDEAHTADFGQWRTTMTDVIELPPDTQAERDVEGEHLLTSPTPIELSLGAEFSALIDTDDDLDTGLERLPRSLLTPVGAPSGQALALQRAQGLKSALLAAGVPEVSIELQIGRPTSGDKWNACTPVCDFSHHVVSTWRAGVFTPVLALCKSGRTDVPGPLCNGYGGWDLCYRILCFGLANHPGEGGPYTINGFRIPKDSARPHCWGTEYEGGTKSSDWDRILTNPRNGRKMTMREFMGRSNVGIQNYFGQGRWPRNAHMEHKTWAPGRKPDRLNYTRETGIAEIVRYAGAVAEEDFMAYIENRAQFIAELAAAFGAQQVRAALMQGVLPYPLGGSPVPSVSSSLQSANVAASGVATILTAINQIDGVDVDEAALASAISTAMLPKLIDALEEHLPSLPDADVQRIADAVSNEQASRMTE